MHKVYGYCRISRKEQNIERQERNIRAAYPEASIVKEAFTGTKVEGRKEFEKLYKLAQRGKVGTIVFDSVSRMSRNAEDGWRLYQEFMAMGVELVFLKEPHINTEVYREAAERQIAAVSTGDAAADEFMKAITDGINKYMMRLAERQVVLVFEQAQKEVDDLHQRTREGIETARRNGKQIGQKAGAKFNVKKAEPAKAIIRKYSKDFEGTLDDVQVMKLAGVARNTYYKYKRELKEVEG